MAATAAGKRTRRNAEFIFAQTAKVQPGKRTSHKDKEDTERQGRKSFSLTSSVAFAKSETKP
jgi:hypothetical protein